MVYLLFSYVMATDNANRRVVSAEDSVWRKRLAQMTELDVKGYAHYDHGAGQLADLDRFYLNAPTWTFCLSRMSWWHLLVSGVRQRRPTHNVVWERSKHKARDRCRFEDDDVLL